MLIIEYFLESNKYGCICCGQFDSWEAFDLFVIRMNYENRKVSQIRLVKKLD